MIIPNDISKILTKLNISYDDIKERILSSIYKSEDEENEISITALKLLVPFERDELFKIIEFVLEKELNTTAYINIFDDDIIYIEFSKKFSILILILSITISITIFTLLIFFIK
ncbi:MAG: hypothetical protein RRZ92_04660 [Bacilli bacterium]